jgi:hypothetical protein
MNELLERKQAIIAQADLHRGLIALERLRLTQRSVNATAFLEHNRWWLLGGAVVVGAVISRRWRGFASWVPTLVATARGLLR